MKRISVILISLVSVLLLAGLCACKQEVTPGEPKNIIPAWEKSDDGLQNLPDINTFGSGTGVTEALVNGLKNPPAFTSAKNLIVLVCEGLTSELIESSASQNDELILSSFPVKGTTSSKFTDNDDNPLSYFSKNGLNKLFTGIVVWGETSTNSMRRMTTTDDNSVERATVNFHQFTELGRPLNYIMGKGDFTDAFNNDSLNDFYKARAVKTYTLEEALPYYKNEEVVFSAVGHETVETSVARLYTIFDNDQTLPSFRQEMAFSLAWTQSVWEKLPTSYRDGFCLLASYSPSSALDSAGVQDFDEGVAIAVKYVLENPDTALLVCGCPADGSVGTVCFFGLGKGVSAQSTLIECVSSLYE